MDVVLGAHDLRVEEPSQQKRSAIRQFTNSYDPENKLNDILILEVGGRPLSRRWLAGAGCQACARAGLGLLGVQHVGLPPGTQPAPFSARGPPTPAGMTVPIPGSPSHSP